MAGASGARSRRYALALLVLSLAAYAPLVAPTAPALFAPLPNAALDAWLAGRFVAVAAKGKSGANVAAAIRRAVAGGQLKGGNGKAAVAGGRSSDDPDAPDVSNAHLGIVTFKFGNTSATPQAAAAVRARRVCATRRAASLPLSVPTLVYWALRVSARHADACTRAGAAGVAERQQCGVPLSGT
jgi:hypothetical protein